METLSGHESIDNCARGPECCAFLGRPRVNEIRDPEIEIEASRMEEISHVLRSEHSAMRVTHLRLKSRRERSAFACASK